jgi:tetratricopeptide (TPR) repeat protein
MIRRFGRDINRRMAVVTGLLSSPAEHDSDEQMLREQRIGLTTFGNFNTHLSFAADMVSSASTAMGVSNASDDHGSDFGDNFPQLPKDQTLHWIESNGIAEAESTTGQLPPDLAPDRAASEWDSDDDMELELARESIRLGDSKLNTEDYKEAEGHFKFSIERVNTSASTAAVMFKEKVVALSGLAQSYFMQAKYDDAEKGLRELIEIDCREENYSDPNDSSLRLAKVLMRKGNFTEASLYARKACKAYKKMGPAMLDRYELSLTLLIEICKASGKKTDEDVYTSLLSNLKLSSPERWEGSMEVRENHGFMQVPIIEAQGLGSERSLPAGNDLQDVKVARADRTLLKKTISQENLLREERMREERTRMRELEERMRENSMRKEGMWEKIMRKVKEEMMLDAGP